MNRLWKYENYVIFLSHENSLVRRWAFNAITVRYQNRYTDEVKKLIGDEDEYLACEAPRYLGRHNALQWAPAILDCFKTNQGYVSSSCASALAEMKYEPALEDIIDSLLTDINPDSLFGVFEYLGSICNGNTREILISAARQINDPLLKGSAFFNLLRHNDPENVGLVLQMVFGSKKQTLSSEDFQIKAIADFWYAEEYFNHLTMFSGDKNITQYPKEVLERFFNRNSHFSVNADFSDMVVKCLEKGQYHNLVTTLMNEVQNQVQHRYPEGSFFESTRDIYVKDTMAVDFFNALSMLSTVWRKPGKKYNLEMDYLIALVLSVYFSVIERGFSVKALGPDAEIKDLMEAVIKSGPNLPTELCKKIVTISPVSELKDSLSKELNTWGDIWIVKIMGKIGSKEFVPDLIRVLNTSDNLSFIYNSAINSLNVLEESAHEMILKSVENKEIDYNESVSIIEHLPFSESFDLICRDWDGDVSDVDSLEIFVSCLRGIGDKRGIEKLQELYAHGVDGGYIGESLECLSLIHNVDIPELPDIRAKREEAEKWYKKGSEDIDELSKDFGETPYKGNAVPFQRETPKIGRNDPCPCGSGKKYKKCCLNKK